MRPSEIIFEVTEAVEGGYDARALGYGIFTQGDTWEELKEMVQDAVLCYFDDDSAPKSNQASVTNAAKTPQEGTRCR